LTSELFCQKSTITVCSLLLKKSNDQYREHLKITHLAYMAEGIGNVVIFMCRSSRQRKNALLGISFLFLQTKSNELDMVRRKS
jgi:hypothetical protein